MPNSDSSGKHDARVKALEQCVAALADHLALYQTLAKYGPAVDNLSIDAATEIWLEDGEYDGTPSQPSLMPGDNLPGVSTSPMRGWAEIAAVLHGDLHLSLVVRLCSVMSLPLIKSTVPAVGVG